MKPALKKLLIFLGVLALLLVGVAAAVPFFVNVDQYRPRIVEAANRRINGKVELGKLSLSLWGQIRIEVGGLSVADAKGTPVLAVKDAFFHLPFSSVLSGSPELVFKMQNPAVNVVKDSAGKLNITTLMKPSQEAEAAEQKDSVVLPGIVAKSRLSLEMRNADIRYKDIASGLEFRVDQFNLNLRDLSLTRTTQFDAWADLNTKMGKTFTLAGPAKISGSAKPEIKANRLERVTLLANADLSQVEILVSDLFRKAKGIDAKVDLAVSANPKEARIEKMDAKFFNAELRSQGVISNLGSEDPAASPVIQFEAKSNEVDLKPWKDLIPMLKEYEVAGKFRMDASAQGPSDRLAYRADLTLSALTLKAGKLKAEPRFDGTVKIVTDKVEDLVMTMKAPGNDLKIQGTVLSFSQPRVAMNVTSSGMDLDQLIDFKKPATAAAPAGSTAGASPAPAGASQETASSDYDSMVAPLRQSGMAQKASGTIDAKIAFIKAYEVKMTDIGGKISFNDLVARLSDFGMKLFDGSVSGSATVNLKPAKPVYSFNAKVTGLDLQQAVTSQFSLMKNTVVGKANVEMMGEGSSFNPPHAKETLNAKGRMRVDQAAFVTVDVLKMATDGINQAIDQVAEKVPPLRGKRVKMPPSAASRYEVISSDFTISGAKFSAPNFVAKAVPNQGIDLKGDTTVGIKDLSLKTRWEIIDTYNLTGARNLSLEQEGVKVEHLLAEGNGPVRIPVSVGCTVTAPCYNYSEAPAFLAKIAMNNLSAGVQAKAKSELKKKAESLIPKGLPKGVQDQIQDFGKKLFGN